MTSPSTTPMVRTLTEGPAAAPPAGGASISPALAASRGPVLRRGGFNGSSSGSAATTTPGRRPLQGTSPQQQATPRLRGQTHNPYAQSPELRPGATPPVQHGGTPPPMTDDLGRSGHDGAWMLPPSVTVVTPQPPQAQHQAPQPQPHGHRSAAPSQAIARGVTELHYMHHAAMTPPLWPHPHFAPFAHPPQFHHSAHSHLYAEAAGAPPVGLPSVPWPARAAPYAPPHGHAYAHGGAAPRQPGGGGSCSSTHGGPVCGGTSPPYAGGAASAPSFPAAPLFMPPPPVEDAPPHPQSLGPGTSAHLGGSLTPTWDGASTVSPVLAHTDPAAAAARQAAPPVYGEEPPEPQHALRPAVYYRPEDFSALPPHEPGAPVGAMPFVVFAPVRAATIAALNRPGGVAVGLGVSRVDLAAPAHGEPECTVFVAQLPFDLPLQHLQTLTAALVPGPPVRLFSIAPHRPARGDDSGRLPRYDGCAFVRMAASDGERVIAALHKRVLFDVDGVWAARTDPQAARLRAYCAEMQHLTAEQRRTQLPKPTPFSAMTAEFSQEKSRGGATRGHHAGPRA